MSFRGLPFLTVAAATIRSLLRTAAAIGDFGICSHLQPMPAAAAAAGTAVLPRAAVLLLVVLLPAPALDIS
jgi:hypothetical protein